MRYIFYHYNEYGTLVFDYYDDETHVSQSYVFYTLKQAVSKFRRDNGLQYKRIKISKLFSKLKVKKANGTSLHSTKIILRFGNAK